MSDALSHYQQFSISFLSCNILSLSLYCYSCSVNVIVRATIVLLVCSRFGY